MCREWERPRWKFWTLHRAIIFANWSVCSWVYILENLSSLTPVESTIFELWWNVQILFTATVFVDMLVIRNPNSRCTGLLVLKTRSGRLSSEISDNPLLYPISVIDCPRPECGVFIVQIIFLQNNLFIFNLFGACLHPHTPTTHITKPHTPEPEILATVCHIIIIFIIFMWYKTIWSTYPRCVSLYINKDKQKKSKVFPFKVRICFMSWYNMLPNMICLWILWKVRQ